MAFRFEQLITGYKCPLSRTAGLSAGRKSALGARKFLEPDLLRLYDEALRSGSDIIERITGDQSQALLRSGIKNFDVLRPDDLHAIDLIKIDTVSGDEPDCVAMANVPQSAEERIAMRRHSDIPFLTGESSIG